MFRVSIPGLSITTGVSYLGFTAWACVDGANVDAIAAWKLQVLMWRYGDGWLRWAKCFEMISGHYDFISIFFFDVVFFRCIGERVLMAQKSGLKQFTR